ncbi:MAG TPA: DNA ligase D [Fimbriimonas sp.]|nr:DNA ligase D [Fimbriimonas sp.]
MLKEYAKKRHFGVTPEPGPQVQESPGELTFVVQKHAATRLHYDFRLELGGVLVSWAVPKGPSLNHADKRLAVHVEDHPLAYGGFEGMIPQGEYGGGEVIVWDRGIYHTDKAPLGRESQEKELKTQLERGMLEFVLEGEKLRGGWVLIHTRGNQWLLIKRDDEFASESDVLAQDHSVLTGHRIGGVADAKHGSVATKTPSNVSRLPDMLPMLLTEAEKPFSNPKWSFELKLDGVRLLTYVNGDNIRMITRNGNEVSSRFPILLPQLRALNLQDTVFDGEVVTFDENGLPNFQALIQPFQAGMVRNGELCLFDLLFCEGKDLRKLPLQERRKELARLAPKGNNLRVLDVYPEDGEALYEAATQMGFEGVVGKRLDSSYESGVRSANWVKLKKYHSEEFVVGGYTVGDGSRESTFGALTLGRMTERGLEFVGKCGGGFDDKKLDEVKDQLVKLKADKSPFVEPLPIKHVKWVRPELVVEVRFMGLTRDQKLRFPIFLRVRPDVPVDNPAPKRGPSVNFKGAKGELTAEVEGHKIRFSSLDKELWPGVTKGDLIHYYSAVSETLLKYLKNRPVSFVRCPEGIQGERFFQKHFDKGRPEFVDVATIHSESNEGPRDFVMCNNLATLLWMGQMAVLEINPWDSRVDPEDGAPESDIDFGTSLESLEDSVLNRPDYLVLDLDPHFGGKATGWKKAEWERLAETAFVLRDLLKSVGLKCFPKSSGKSGLHLYLPISRDYTYDQVRAAAMAIGKQAAAKLGTKITLEWNTKKRPDGVFIDVNQNVRGKTMAAPYSPRAALGAGVSMPLLWSELERIDPTEFTVLTALDRLSEKGDLWAETLGLHQKLG